MDRDGDKAQRGKGRTIDRNKTVRKGSTVHRQQSAVHSSSVSPGTFLSDIQVYIPRTTPLCVCVAMLAEANAPIEPQHLPLTSLSQNHPSMEERRET